VAESGGHTPHSNPGHGGRCGDGADRIFISVTHCGTCAASQQPAVCSHKQIVLLARRDRWRLPAPALPHAPGQVRHPRIRAGGGARARDHSAAREGKVAQQRDHRRLSRHLHRLKPAVAVAEPLARRGGADEVVQMKLLAHACQHLERKVQQGSCARRRAHSSHCGYFEKLPGTHSHKYRNLKICTQAAHGNAATHGAQHVPPAQLPPSAPSAPAASCAVNRQTPSASARPCSLVASSLSRHTPRATCPCAN
jgi:hypothetical protein